MTTIRSFITCTLILLIGWLLPAGLVSASSAPPSNPQELAQFLESYRPAAIDKDNRQIDFAGLMQNLQGKRAVFVGETHDRYDHHLNQLAILHALHQQTPRIGIGVEWFQQPFQTVIDQYLADKISEGDMLRQTGYYHRWRYDYRMLRPIVEFAKANHLPLIALNAPTEITAKVAASGLDSLSPEERAQIPQHITPPDTGYLQRLRQAFARHAQEEGQFENFTAVQRLWDETMAANIVRFLQSHPDHNMIVFAGSGHVGHNTGIPADVARTMPGREMVTLHSSDAHEVQSDKLVDFFVATEPLSLPPTGKLGVWLAPLEDGVKIGKLLTGSPAARAGLRQGDHITRLGDTPITSMDDLMIILANLNPGEQIILQVERTGKTAKGIRTESIRLTLQ